MVKRAMKILSAMTAATGLTIMLTAPAMASDPKAATYVGAYANPWATGNSTIGPLQSTRLFYVTLPTSITTSPGNGETACTTANVPISVVCVISYKTMDTNLAAFIASIPSNRHVVLIWHHEPENDTFSGPGTNGQNFVSDFETESNAIRADAAADSLPDVKVAMAAEAYQYQAGTKFDNGIGCSFIPPDQYVDFYFVDIYDPTPNGKSLPDSPVGNQWSAWLSCVTAANNANPHPRKAEGIAEYGLGSSGSSAENATREQTLVADDAYLKASFTNFYLWEYWWNDPTTGNACAPNLCQFTDQATITEWQEIEAGN